MTTSKGKEIIDGGWKASGISDASKLGSQKLSYIDPFHEIDPMLGDNADQAADDNSHLLPVCDVCYFLFICILNEYAGSIQQ